MAVRVGSVSVVDSVADVLMLHIADDEAAYNAAAAVVADTAITVRRRRVIAGEWPAVLADLDELPEGARIVIADGDLAVKRRNVFGHLMWHSTRSSIPERSEDIARDNAPIEVLA
jgi:hypothetical protein